MMDVHSHALCLDSVHTLTHLECRYVCQHIIHTYMTSSTMILTLCSSYVCHHSPRCVVPEFCHRHLPTTYMFVWHNTSSHVIYDITLTLCHHSSVRTSLQRVDISASVHMSFSSWCLDMMSYHDVTDLHDCSFSIYPSIILGTLWLFKQYGICAWADSLVQHTVHIYNSSYMYMWWRHHLYIWRHPW